MRWHIQQTIPTTDSKDRLKHIAAALLKNRQITSTAQAKQFLKPNDPLDLTIEEVGISPLNLKKALRRVDRAIKNSESILIFGDYDADGITATAILWETLQSLTVNATPFIPHREKHGYGLSIKAIDDILATGKPDLIITVDNGIVAHEAANYIAKQGIDLIITDHHTSADTLPTAHSIVHTTQLAGAGVSWMFAREILKAHTQKWQSKAQSTLDLATIGTVADQVPLQNANRSLVAKGLEYIRHTKRVGLLELFSQAQFDPTTLSTYHINFVIAPRINAMGRLAHGLDSLKLLCTGDETKAKQLAATLGSTNQERQDLTFELLEIAKAKVTKEHTHLIVVDDREFHEGVIGLVAGRLTETHYKPTIVIGRGEIVSKASARSVAGVNIIELIRQASDLLINAGGHPMAAGFTIHTTKIAAFKTVIADIAQKSIDPSLLTPTLNIDCELTLADITTALHQLLLKLEPYGPENQKPLFCLKNVPILEKMTIGKDKNHLKLIVPSQTPGQSAIDALWFGKADKIDSIGKAADIAFMLDENSWNGKTKLQLIIKDLQTQNTPAK